MGTKKDYKLNRRGTRIQYILVNVSHFSGESDSQSDVGLDGLSE